MDALSSDGLRDKEGKGNAALPSSPTEDTLSMGMGRCLIHINKSECTHDYLTAGYVMTDHKTSNQSDRMQCEEPPNGQVQLLSEPSNKTRTKTNRAKDGSADHRKHTSAGSSLDAIVSAIPSARLYNVVAIEEQAR